MADSWKKYDTLGEWGPRRGLLAPLADRGKGHSGPLVPAAFVFRNCLHPPSLASPVIPETVHILRLVLSVALPEVLATGAPRCILNACLCTFKQLLSLAMKPINTRWGYAHGTLDCHAYMPLQIST